MSEHTDCRFFGMPYVIAGRMVRTLTKIRESIDDRSGPDRLEIGDSEASMKLWSVRNHLVENYRRIRFDRMQAQPARRNA